MMRVTLQHVALETRSADVDAAVAFWRALGFAPVAVPQGLRGTSTWLQRAGTQIHLLHAEDAIAPPRGHAAVVAEDYDAALAALAAAGHAAQPRAEHWGARRAFVHAPGGHRVEVMERPPA